MDADDIGLLLVGLATGALMVRLATGKRPELRFWARASSLLIFVILVGLGLLLLDGLSAGFPD